MRYNKKQTGFTLIEILVAVAIFAFMSVIALTGIKSIMDAQEVTNKVSAQMKAIQSSFFYLERDIRYIVNRGVRDELGGTEAALQSGTSGFALLSLTRDGRRNPQQLNRSSLIRVAYRLREKTLLRTQFASLDRGSEAIAMNRDLLGNVEELNLRFLDANNRWVDFWPPVNPGAISSDLPRAIEVVIQHETLGKIRRLIPVTGT